MHIHITEFQRMPILITLLSWHVKFSKDLTKSRLRVSNLCWCLTLGKKDAIEEMKQTLGYKTAEDRLEIAAVSGIFSKLPILYFPLLRYYFSSKALSQSYSLQVRQSA